MARNKCFDMLESEGGPSTVYCLMASPSLIPKITMFTISGRPIGLAADLAFSMIWAEGWMRKGCIAKKESGLAKYQFTWETIDVYSGGVYNGMLDSWILSHFYEVTQGLSKSVYKAATNAFPYTMGNAPKLGRFIHNSWHVEECHVEEVWDLSIPL